MKRMIKVFSFVLVIAMLFELIQIPAFATDGEYVRFDDIKVSETLKQTDVFYIGSTNMTISEKSQDKYLMKIGRGGSLDGDADITVKFMDVTAKYGENYKISSYDGASEINDESGVSVVDVIKESGTDFIEREEDDTRAISDYVDENGADILDKNGDVVVSTVMVPDGSGYSILDKDGNEAIKYSENGDTSDTATESVEDIMNNSDVSFTQEDLNAATNDMIKDDFPGTEITLHFGAGENEKFVIIEALYSEMAEGDTIANVLLKNPVGNTGITEDMGSAIRIIDEDESSDPVLSLAQSEYVADGESIDVEIKRSGRLNDLVSAYICTYSDEESGAEMGRDFQGYSAQVDFAPGMESRTVTVQTRHISDEERSFKICLNNPTGCVIENGEAVVTITGKEKNIDESENLAEVILSPEGSDNNVDLSADGNSDNVELSATTNPFRFVFDEPIPLSRFGLRTGKDQNVTRQNRYGRDCIVMSGKSVSGGVWQDCWAWIGNKYLYDGVNIQWETWWRRPSYFYNTIDVYGQCWADNTKQEVYRTENEPNEYEIHTFTQLFPAPPVDGIRFSSVTTSWNGFNLALYEVKPLLRNFQFEITAPEKYLSFENVDAETAKGWQEAAITQIPTGQKVFEGTLNDWITVAKQGSLENAKYAHLKAVDIVLPKGKRIRINNNTNTEAVTFQLDRNLMNQIACDQLNYSTKTVNGRRVGTGIQIKPVFEYNNAKVRIEARDNDAGYLKIFRNGSWRTITRQEDLDMHIGDRLRVYSQVKDGYENYYLPWGTHYQVCDTSWKPIQKDGKAEYYSQSIKDRANYYINLLEDDVRNNKNDKELKKDYDEAKKFAFDNDMLTQNQKNLLALSLNFLPESEEDYDIPETTDGYYRLKHVDSQWIGGKNILADNENSDYDVLQLDSIGQTYSDIVSLGADENGHEKMLLVFLSDESEKDEYMEPEICYSIYDCTTDEWQDPVALTNDDSFKFYPNICLAGDKVLLLGVNIHQKMRRVQKAMLFKCLKMLIFMQRVWIKKVY